jgi:3'-phosphoadenosine 5'-phosphosulfate (PAPS) 3'-phosphatase
MSDFEVSNTSFCQFFSERKRFVINKLDEQTSVTAVDNKSSTFVRRRIQPQKMDVNLTSRRIQRAPSLSKVLKTLFWCLSDVMPDAKMVVVVLCVRLAM